MLSVTDEQAFREWCRLHHFPERSVSLEVKDKGPASGKNPQGETPPPETLRSGKSETSEKVEDD